MRGITAPSFGQDCRKALQHIFECSDMQLYTFLGGDELLVQRHLAEAKTGSITC